MILVYKNEMKTKRNNFYNIGTNVFMHNIRTHVFMHIGIYTCIHVNHIHT